VHGGHWALPVIGSSETTLLDYLRPGAYTVYVRQGRPIVPGLKNKAYYLEGEVLAHRDTPNRSLVRIPPANVRRLRIVNVGVNTRYVNLVICQLHVVLNQVSVIVHLIRVSPRERHPSV